MCDAGPWMIDQIEEPPSKHLFPASRWGRNFHSGVQPRAFVNESLGVLSWRRVILVGGTPTPSIGVSGHAFVAFTGAAFGARARA